MPSRSMTFEGLMVLSLLLSLFSAQAKTNVTQKSPSVDTLLPKYDKPAGPLKGRLRFGGGGTMERLLMPLLDEFTKLHPDVSHEITLRGSTYVPSSLAHHEYTVGLMSRAMTPAEKASVRKETGHDVIEVVIAADAILVLVNKDNPVEGITLPQLDALFGTKKLAGYDKPITTWGDLGVKGTLAASKISPYGILEEKNGTVETFRRLVLLGGPLNRLVGNIKYPEKEFGQAVAADRAGISYNIDLELVAGARAIGVATKEGAPFVLPDSKSVSEGTYPLSRYLYVYISDTTDRSIVEFVRFALSYDGQQIIAGTSATPLSAGFAEKQRKSVAK